MISRSTDIRAALASRRRQRGFIINPYVYGTVDANAAAIYAALRAWWSLDENAASPTYADSHSGAHHLTQRNAGGSVNTSVNTVAGLISQAWHPNLTDNLTCYIPRSDTALDMTDTDFSFGGWFKLDASPSVTKFVIGRIGSLFTKLQAWIWIDSADSQIKGRYSSNGSAAAATVSSGVADSGVYQLVVLTYNKTGSKLELRLRKVANSLISVSTALSGAIFTTSTNCNFTIGEGLENDANFEGSNRDGVTHADECFFIDKAINDTEFNYLYNGGAGKSYSDLVADAT